MPGKIRSPWAIIGLSIITLGIYGLYWQYATLKEMKDYSREGIGGGLGLNRFWSSNTPAAAAA